MKQTPDKPSTLKELRAIRDRIMALEAAEVRRENAARVFERARIELESRIGKQSIALKSAEKGLREIEIRNKQADLQVRLLSGAVEQSSEGVSLCDLEGNLVYVNQAFAQLHGYTPDDLIGKPMSICQSPDQMDSVEEADKTLHETGAFAGEVQHLRRDEAVFPARVHRSMLKDQDGKKIGIISTLRDMSQLQNAEAACVHSKDRVTQLLQILPDGVLICDEKFNIIAANKQACECLLYEQDELLNLSLADIQEGFSAEEMSKIRAELEVGALHTVEPTHCRKDGSTFTATTKLGLLKSGESMDMIVIVPDKAEEEAAIADMQMAQATLQARVHEQNEELNKARVALSGQRAAYSRETEWLKKAKLDLEAKVEEQSAELASSLTALQRAQAELASHAEMEATELLLAQEQLQVATSELEGATASGEQVRAELEKRLEVKTAKLIKMQIEFDAKLEEHSQASAEVAVAASVADEMNAPMETVDSILNILKISHRKESSLMPGMDLGALFRFEQACKSLRKSINNLRGMSTAPTEEPAPAEEPVPAAKPAPEDEPVPEETPVPVNVNSIIGKTISPMIGKLKSNGIKLNLKLCSTMPKTTAAPGRLGEVFQKLITRASRAIVSSQESVFAEITIETMVQKDRVIIKFSDNGPVLSEAEIKSIFKAPPPEDDGVDLSVCRSTLEKYSGTIGVKHPSDGGMVFTIKLPVC